MRIYYFDICAIITLGLMIFSVYSRKMNRGRLNSVFVGLSWLALADTIFDLICNAPLEHFPAVMRSIAFRTVSCYGYFALRVLTAAVYALLIFVATGYAFKNSKVLKILFVVPVVVDYIFLIQNIWTRNVFYYTYKDSISDLTGDAMITTEYHRGPLIPIIYIVSILYLVLGIARLIQKRKMFGRSKFIAYFAIFPLNFLAVGLQFVYPRLLVEMFAMMISLYLISITIMRPEDTVDPTSGAKVYNAYKTDFLTDFDAGRNEWVIIFKITNDMSLNSLLDETMYRAITSHIVATVFKDADKHARGVSDVYYLQHGRYVCEYRYRTEQG